MKRIALTLALCLALGAAAEAGKVKEKANKSKCENRIRSIAEQGIGGMERTVALLLPAIQKVRALGNEDAAWQITENGVRQVRHRGHVTVLKINQTADACIARLRRQGADRKTILGVQAAREAARLRVERATRHAVDSFFDIWVEV